MKENEKITDGHIVTESCSNENISDNYSIAFCCNDSDSLSETCHKRKVRITEVLKDLESPVAMVSEKFEFKEWPLDLLCDYILKVHHRNIRKQGPEITALLNKVCNIHGEQYPELYTIQDHLADSLESLYEHLEKEELVFSRTLNLMQK